MQAIGNSFDIKSLITKVFSKSLYTLSLFARKVSSAFVAFVLARLFSVEIFGLYSSYATIAGFILIISNFGFHEYLLVNAKGDKKLASTQVQFFSVIAFIVFTLITFIALLFNVDEKLIFLLILIKVFMENQLSTIFLAYFQANKKLNLIAVINISYVVSILAMLVVAFMMKFDIKTYLIAYLTLTTINIGVQLFCIKPDFLKIIKDFFKLAKSINKSLFYYGFVIVSSIYMQIPNYFIAVYVDKEQAGIYFAALYIASLSMLISTAQIQKILPDLVTANTNKSLGIIKKNILLVFSINFLLLLSYFFFGKNIILLIYSKTAYLESYYPLLILAITYLLFSVSSLFGAYITAKGLQNKKFEAQLEFIVIMLVLSFIFIKNYGIVGAAYTYLSCCTYVILKYAYLVYNDVKLKKMKIKNKAD